MLTGFEGEEEKCFQETLTLSVQAVRTALIAGAAEAMNKFNAMRVEMPEAKMEDKKEN